MECVVCSHSIVCFGPLPYGWDVYFDHERIVIPKKRKKRERVILKRISRFTCPEHSPRLQE